MQFKIGKYHLDVDIERTKAYYASQDGISCDCAGCRNYEKAIPHLSNPILSFLYQFGIEPQNPMEMSVLHSPDGETTLYNGFFYICGTILVGSDPWIPVGANTHQLDESYRIDLTETSSAYFEEEPCRLDKTFPAPTIHLDITFSLPWLLDEPNPYQ